MAVPLSTPPPNKRLFDPDATIVLVGCRGAGKRTLGFIGAMHLRRRLITEDHYFEQVTGVSRGHFLARHGGEAFAQRNAEVFRQMLDANPRRCIIECGMSSLAKDAQVALRAYGETHPIIYVHREREQILRFLDAADADQLLRADQSHRQCANLEYYNLYDPYRGRSSTTGSNGESGESAVNTSGTNSPWDPYQPNSNGSGAVSGKNSPLAGSSSRLFYAKEDFTRFLDLLQEQPWRKQWAESPFSINALPPEFRAYSYTLRLRLSDLLDMDMEWEEFEARGDCVELIIDHWPDDLLSVIARQVALIRRKLAVPIIYNVEEKPREERSRPPEERDRVDTELLELGLRLNVEYLSLDLQRNNDLVQHVLARRGRTSIIGNFWYPGLTSPQWSSFSLVQDYERAKRLNCNVVRIVRFCTGGGSPDEPLAFKSRIAQTVPNPKPPLVAYDYSLLGVRLPLQGRILNPVKHPNLPNRRDHLASVATNQSAMLMQFQLGKADALNFYTIGSHIAYSITPALHTAAYSFWSMSHKFQAVECSTIDDLKNLFLSMTSSGNSTFGGATLASPFKITIRPYLKLESKHASAIGAVNVILPMRGHSDAVIDHVKARNKAGACNEFYGDNTDWSSMYKCIQRALSPRNVVQPSRTTALVIGAGGMARAAIYALIRLGCRHIFIYNRTPQNAVDVATHFDNWAQNQGQNQPLQAATNGTSGTGSSKLCHVLTSKSDPWPAEFQQPTMIVSCVPVVNTDGSPAAGFEMPRQWLNSPTGGVVVELAYEPLITPLVAQIQNLRDTVNPAWVIVDGLEVVSEMAIEAFELMTDRTAPKRLMRSVCRQAWDQQRRGMSASASASSYTLSAPTTVDTMMDGS
ncbi:repressor protein [Sporothrix brasiliensis 5110]|uniref:Repressor protein n=1 Tax=Sporothrix brasiliensis 5110 TaxID=1398154 RepID=A0A0C2FPR3_9PEZI|nr:repressor protein [Sporothrix brasiliensis 5110]KIH93048.1 repressor protein [Sporothrix brasiliensis 5110]